MLDCGDFLIFLRLGALGSLDMVVDEVDVICRIVGEISADFLKIHFMRVTTHELNFNKGGAGFDQ